MRPEDHGKLRPPGGSLAPLGRKPIAPFAWPGMRQDPAPSDPTPKRDELVAIATPSPPVDPPAPKLVVAGIQSSTPKNAVRVHCEARLRHVGLGDDDGTGIDENLDEDAVVRRNSVGIWGESFRCGKAVQVHGIFDCHGDAMKRTNNGAVSLQDAVELLGAVNGGVKVDFGEMVGQRMRCSRALAEGSDDLFCGQIARSDSFRGFGEIVLGGIRNVQLFGRQLYHY